MLSIAQLKVRDSIYELIRKEYAQMDVPIPLESCSPEDLADHRQQVEARRKRITKRADEMTAMLETLGLKRHA
jgi:hypothetical protein